MLIIVNILLNLDLYNIHYHIVNISLNRASNNSISNANNKVILYPRVWHLRDNHNSQVHILKNMIVDLLMNTIRT